MHLNSGKHKPDSPKLTDVALFQALKAGDPSAITTLYDCYAALVYGLALKILKEPQAAEDLTQEIFLELWHKKNYNPTRSSLSSFLVVLTRSRAIDKLRSHKTKLKYLDKLSQQIPADRNIPFEQASIAERSQKIHSALALIPDLQRQVLEMAYYEGLSQSEIAKTLDMPLGTVKTRARQGLLKLKTILKDWIN